MEKQKSVPPVIVFMAVFMSIIFLTMSAAPAYAQKGSGTARVTNVSCDTSDSTELVVTFTLEVWDLQNREITVGVWPRYTGSDELIAATGTVTGFTDVNGFIVSYEDVTPPYASTIWDEYVIVLPVEVLPSGNYTFYPQIDVQYNRDTLISYFGDDNQDCLIDHTTTAATNLDPFEDPNYGTVRLLAGFLPDPYEVNLTSGGVINVNYLGTPCAGFATEAPDYNLVWSGNADFLRIYFDSNDDTTLVINDPNGSWYCNDDFNGLDPQISFANPVAGTYNIWVGSYSNNEFITGELNISEFRR